MKKFFKISSLIVAGIVASLSPVFTSCDNNDFDTNQYVGGVNLNAFGPSPVARGGQLRFIGSGMDQITKISIPGCDDITDIDVVNSGEIRCKVPQNAEPGTILLHHAKGVIETKTMITYLEPISIEAISPVKVKPGETITIKGDYLNLINEVCFPFTDGCDSVNVFKTDFLSHSRPEIQLTVPAEAVSGYIFLSDAKEVPNMIESEISIEVVLPSVDAPVDLTDAKGGQEVTVVGDNFDLIKSIEMPDGSEVEFTLGEKDGRNSLTFTIGEYMTDGPVCAVTASHVKIAIANIGMVLPTELSASPAEGLRGGDIVEIKGVNMDQVSAILFPGVSEPVVPEEITATSVKVIFPAMGRSGVADVQTKSGKTVSLELATAKPEVTGFNPDPVSAAASLTIAGRNLDLVSKIVFAGDVEGNIDAHSADAITLVAPATAQSGALVLEMANGESVTTAPLTINAPECAFITSIENQELTAGQILVANVVNADKLTGVTVNGAAVQYIVNGDKLLVNLPDTCGAGTVVTLVSSNGEISYTYDVIPATHVEKVIFNEMFNLGNWDAGGLRLYKEDLEGIPAGAKLIFYLAAASDAQIQINDANWGQLDIIEVPAGSTTAEYVLTADALNRVLTTDDGWSTTAIVVNGHTAVISKIAVAYERSLETTIWEGSWNAGGWGGNQDLAWGGYDWSSVKPGAILRLYVTPTVANPESDWWCVAVRHGNGWGMLPAPCPDQWGMPVSGVVALELEKVLLDDLVAEQGLVITGADYILTRVTIE